MAYSTNLRIPRVRRVELKLIKSPVTAADQKFDSISAIQVNTSPFSVFSVSSVVASFYLQAAKVFAILLSKTTEHTEDTEIFENSV
jgi:hypothetical protein